MKHIGSEMRWPLYAALWLRALCGCHVGGQVQVSDGGVWTDAPTSDSNKDMEEVDARRDDRVSLLSDIETTDTTLDVQQSDLPDESNAFFEAPARFVSAQCAMACAVLSNGAVYCWGRSVILNNGGVGAEHFRPRKIRGLENIEQFASSCFVGCGVDRSHAVWCFGSNYYSLQTGTRDSYIREAQRRQDVDGIVQVELWGYAFLARHMDGSLRAWFGAPYELLRFSFAEPIREIQAGGTGEERDGYCVVLANGEVACADARDPHAMPRRVAGLTEVVSVAPGYSHSCVLKRDSTVWCWGRNDFGETGTSPESSEQCAGQAFPDERGNLVRPFHACVRQPRQVLGLSDVVELGVAEGRSCVRKRDGTVWCWGGNVGGRLGDGLPPSEVCPAVAWDPPRLTPPASPCRRRPSQVSGLSGIISLAVADGFVCAVQSNGQVWCWGTNNQGSLGTGDQVSSAVPVLVPASALRRDR